MRLLPTTRRGELALLGALAVASLLPFLDAAISIDGPVFVAVTRQILKSPADPFGFEMIWDPTSPFVHEFNRNPPLLSYWLAPVAWLFGEWEPALHAALIPFSVAAVLSFSGIARRLAGDGFAPALLLWATPAYAVLATNLMLDVPLLAWMLLAVYALLRGREGSPRWLVVAGLAASAAGLTKYVGFAVAPLLAAGSLLLCRRRGLALACAVGIPLAVWAAWGAYTVHLYGSVHFLGATDVLAGKLFDPDEFWNHVASVPVYYGCGLLFPIFAWLWAIRGRLWSPELAVLGVLTGAAVVTWVLPHGEPTRRVPLGVEEAAFAAFGLAGAFVVIGHSLRPSRFLASPEDGFLMLWLAGILVFSLFLNWHVNTADALLAAPPLLLLMLRDGSRRPTRRMLLAWVAILLPISLLLAWADAIQAGVYRTAAQRIAREIGNDSPRGWFVGHWGLQHYLEALGFKPVVPPQYERRYGRSKLEAGDWVVSARNVSQLDVSRNMNSYRIRPVWNWKFETWLPLRTNNPDAGAGFYSHHGGYVPYAWSNEPIEEIGLGRVLGPRRPAPGARPDP